MFPGGPFGPGFPGDPGRPRFPGLPRRPVLPFGPARQGPHLSYIFGFAANEALV